MPAYVPLTKQAAVMASDIWTIDPVPWEMVLLGDGNNTDIFEECGYVRRCIKNQVFQIAVRDIISFCIATTEKMLHIAPFLPELPDTVKNEIMQYIRPGMDELPKLSFAAMPQRGTPRDGSYYRHCLLYTSPSPRD